MKAKHPDDLCLLSPHSSGSVYLHSRWPNLLPVLLEASKPKGRCRLFGQELADLLHASQRQAEIPDAVLGPSYASSVACRPHHLWGGAREVPNGSDRWDLVAPG